MSVAVLAYWGEPRFAAACRSASVGGVSLWVDGGLLCPRCETARPLHEYGTRDRVRKYAAVLDVVRVCPDCRHVFATHEPDPATSEGL